MRIVKIILSVLLLLNVLSCFAGEDYGGVTKLCFDFNILRPNKRVGYFEEISSSKSNSYFSLIKASSQKYKSSINIISFVKNTWLNVPFRKKYFEYKAERDCILVWDFFTMYPMKHNDYWSELKMFVDDKQVSPSAFKVKFNKDKFATIIEKRSNRNKYKKVPAATQGGVVINYFRRATYSKLLKKGETFKFNCQIRAISEIK